MRTRKRVWIDFTYYDPSRAHAPIAAWFEKDTDEGFVQFIREADAAKEIKAWKLAAETWKKSFNDLVGRIARRRNKKVKR